jgi:hypothetical protein
MKKQVYEYKVIEVYSPRNAQMELDAFSNQGWRLVSVKNVGCEELILWIFLERLKKKKVDGLSQKINSTPVKMDDYM